MHGAKSALITYVQFKFHVIDLKGNYSHGWIASADTSVIIFSSIFNTSSTFYTCFPVVRSNWGRLLRLAHLATFFRRLILSTSHVFFHQPTVLKKGISALGEIFAQLWNGRFRDLIFLSFTLFQNQENKKKGICYKISKDLLEYLYMSLSISGSSEAASDIRTSWETRPNFRYHDVAGNET